MSVLTVVYGGQFGSEGKGQIAAYLAQRRSLDVAVRVGGPNAGHTFLLRNGAKQVVQNLPAPAFFNTNTISVIGAAGIVIPDILAKEIQQAVEANGNVPISVYLDKGVAVITAAHMRTEAHLKKNIGSTGEGVGAATAQRVMREPTAVLAYPDTARAFFKAIEKDSWGSLVFLSNDTPKMLNKYLTEGAQVLIEGTQGVGLSLHTSGYYPFCTSRECTPQGMLAQTGIASDNAKKYEKIMVIRSFPIRVGGNSGDLPGEITWAELKEITGGYVKEAETTTVTKKKRRIADIDFTQLRRNVMITRPTALALTFFDYWFPEIQGALDASALDKKHWKKINQIEDVTGVPVHYLSTGFGTVIPLRVTL